MIRRLEIARLIFLIAYQLLAAVSDCNQICFGNFAESARMFIPLDVSQVSYPFYAMRKTLQRFIQQWLSGESNPAVSLPGHRRERYVDYARYGTPFAVSSVKFRFVKLQYLTQSWRRNGVLKKREFNTKDGFVRKYSSTASRSGQYEMFKAICN